MKLATLGNGCFWCTEAIFKGLKGVEKVAPGYTGGSIENPTYKQICTGQTGHAEVIQITYNPIIINFEELLQAFFASHNSTTLNRQGSDRGTQYRSAIFFHDEAQQEIAEKAKIDLDASNEWRDPIVTEVVALEKFYPADNYHLDYFNQNRNQPYCFFVIRPKVESTPKSPQTKKVSFGDIFIFIN